MDEFWLESDEEEYNAAELERDPDWIQTPHVKRKNNRKTSRLSESDSEKQTQNGDTASKSLEKQMVRHSVPTYTDLSKQFNTHAMIG